MKEPFNITEKFTISKDGCEIELSEKEQKELYEALKKKFDKSLDYSEILKKIKDYQPEPIVGSHKNPYIPGIGWPPVVTYKSGDTTVECALNGITLGSSEGHSK